jgi:hypothetical protein
MARNLLSAVLLFFSLSLNAQKADTLHRAVLDFKPGIGILGMFDPGNEALILDLQVISSQKFWILKPFGGIMANTYGDVYFYAGINIPFKLARFLEVGIGFAPGYYYLGQGINLGYPLEFRSSVNLNYVFPGKTAIGLEFSHISNANLGTSNPGTETLVVYFRFPLFFSGKTATPP